MSFWSIIDAIFGIILAFLLNTMIYINAYLQENHQLSIHNTKIIKWFSYNVILVVISIIRIIINGEFNYLIFTILVNIVIAALLKIYNVVERR